VKKKNAKSEDNPEFENVKTAFRKLLSVPKEKIDELEKKQAKPPRESKPQDCK
jgi:hypothetical protein